MSVFPPTFLSGTERAPPGYLYEDQAIATRSPGPEDYYMHRLRYLLLVLAALVSAGIGSAQNNLSINGNNFVFVNGTIGSSPASYNL